MRHSLRASQETLILLPAHQRTGISECSATHLVGGSTLCWGRMLLFPQNPAVVVCDTYLSCSLSPQLWCVLLSGLLGISLIFGFMKLWGNTIHQSICTDTWRSIALLIAVRSSPLPIVAPPPDNYRAWIINPASGLTRLRRPCALKPPRSSTQRTRNPLQGCRNIQHGRI